MGLCTADDLTDWVRALWAPPDSLSVSEWADQHIRLPEGTPRPGRWQTSLTPYLREIMDSLADPDVERLTFMSCTQVGKTAALLNSACWIMAQDPADIVFVLPRDTDAESMCVRRLQQVVNASPTMRGLMTGKPRDFKRVELATESSVVYFVGSNSPAALASRPVRYLLLDEVDKYKRYLSREADPVSLAIERTKAYHDRKVVMASTPTTRDGLIWREWELSDQRRYHVPCPTCGSYQPLLMAQLHWPQNMTPEQIGRGQCVTHRCAACAVEWRETAKRDLLAKGVWCPDGTAVSLEGAVEGASVAHHRGYNLSTLYSPWVSWGEVVAEFLRAKDDVEQLRNWVNSWDGWIWEDRTADVPVSRLVELAQDYPVRTVPAGAKVLTAGVDVQAPFGQLLLYYVIRAWGDDEESWLVEAGRVEQWDTLADVLFRASYPQTGGDVMPVRLACIDSGYKRDEVYTFCRQHPVHARPTKGRERLDGQCYFARPIETTINGRAIPTGMRLFTLDTSYLKNKLNRLQHEPESARGGWWLHKDPSTEYLSHLTAEHRVRDRNGVEHWRPKTSGAQNHWLDAEVYALAAAEMLGVWALRKRETKPPVARPPADNQPPIVGPGARAPRPSWIRGSRGGARRKWL